MRTRCATLAVLCLLSIGCNDDFLVPTGADDDEVSRVLALVGNTTSGEGQFDEHCELCHVKSGTQASVGPALAGVTERRTDEEIVALILGGVGAMPPVNVTEQGCADILAFMKATYAEVDVDTDASEPDLVNGEEVFVANCRVCHPSDGSPGIGVGLSAAVPMLTEGEIETVIVDGQGQMPGFTFPDGDLRDVVAWVIDSFGG